MPTHVLFIHSAGAQVGNLGSTPFVEQLRQALGDAYELHCPPMPLPEQPTYERWSRELAVRLAAEPAPAILVGHSLGGSVLLKYLSEQESPIQATGLFLVAAPFWTRRHQQTDGFVLREDFARCFPDTLRIHLYQSEDDNVVPIEQLLRYQRALPQAAVTRLGHGGHTFKNGLPELVRDIRALRVPQAGS